MPKTIEEYLKDINKQFRKSQINANKLISDQVKTKTTMHLAWKKANNKKGDLKDIWNQLILGFALIKDYLNGKYTEVPFRSITAILAGLIYFISPLDAIPDFMLGFGYIDDVFVLTLILKQVSEDLKRYQLWKEKT